MNDSPYLYFVTSSTFRRGVVCYSVADGSLVQPVTLNGTFSFE